MVNNITNIIILEKDSIIKLDILYLIIPILIMKPHLIIHLNITNPFSLNYKNNLSISVQNGEVVVCAPWYLSRNQIQKIVEEKRNWIIN